jgi:rod shape-determining protein MreC
MESFLNRYRNITVLLLVIFAQLALLAVQVKNDQDVRIIRVWTVTAVTPVARIIEGLRGGSLGFVRNYILLHDASEENRRLQGELNQLKLENIFLKNELNTADRARALQMFQAHTPSRTVAAKVIGTAAGTNSKVVFVDRGSSNGVERGMAVVTPEGIVGKVIAAYPTASQVMLATDPDFAAGVVSQKNQAHGTVKGQGTPMDKVDYVPMEEKVDPGEWFYTSGDDRIFPRGFPVGVAKVVHDGQPFKEIYIEPSGLQRGVEEVLILVEGVHQNIPEAPPANQPVYIAPPPPQASESGAGTAPGGPGSGSGTEADKLRTMYKAIGDAQNHKFGEGLPGSKPPNFNMPVPQPGAGAAAGGTAQQSGAVSGGGTASEGRGAATPGAAAPTGAPAQGRGAAPVTGNPAAGRGTPGAARGPAQPGSAEPAPRVPAPGRGPSGSGNPEAPRDANPPAGRGRGPAPAPTPGTAAPPGAPVQGRGADPVAGNPAADRGTQGAARGAAQPGSGNPEVPRGANPPAGRGRGPAPAPTPDAVRRATQNPGPER